MLSLIYKSILIVQITFFLGIANADVSDLESTDIIKKYFLVNSYMNQANDRLSDDMRNLLASKVYGQSFSDKSSLEILVNSLSKGDSQIEQELTQDLSDFIRIENPFKNSKVVFVLTPFGIMKALSDEWLQSQNINFSSNSKEMNIEAITYILDNLVRMKLVREFRRANSWLSLKKEKKQLVDVAVLGDSKITGKIREFLLSFPELSIRMDKSEAERGSSNLGQNHHQAQTLNRMHNSEGAKGWIYYLSHFDYVRGKVVGRNARVEFKRKDGLPLISIYVEASSSLANLKRKIGGIINDIYFTSGLNFTKSSPVSLVDRSGAKEFVFHIPQAFSTDEKLKRLLVRLKTEICI